MAIEKWSDIIPSIVKVPITVYTNRHKIQKWWKHAQAYLNKGNTNIVVLGRPNVGKSVMAAYLHNETSNLSWDLPDTSTDVETKALTLENWTKLVRVIPEQKIANRYSGIEEAFNKHEALEGIIYVVDYGFTDEKRANIKQRMIDGKNERKVKINTIEKIRAKNLESELTDFKGVCEQIRKAFSMGKSPK